MLTRYLREKPKIGGRYQRLMGDIQKLAGENRKWREISETDWRYSQTGGKIGNGGRYVELAGDLLGLVEAFAQEP